MKQELTYEEAHRLFRYDAESGKLYWRVAPARNVKAGDEAGTVHHHRRTMYRLVKVSGKNYRVHRIIWLMLYGTWPKHDIDHADGDGLNNRPGNLRDVPNIVNGRNRRMYRNNTSGVNGVCWKKTRGKWQARSIDSKGTRKHLGLFTDIKAAEKAVREFQVERGFSERHGLAC